MQGMFHRAPDLSGSGLVEHAPTRPVALGRELLLLQQERGVKLTHDLHV